MTISTMFIIWFAADALSVLPLAFITNFLWVFTLAFCTTIYCMTETAGQTHPIVNNVSLTFIRNYSSCRSHYGRTETNLICQTKEWSLLLFQSFIAAAINNISKYLVELSFKMTCRYDVSVLFFTMIKIVKHY